MRIRIRILHFNLMRTQNNVGQIRNAALPKRPTAPLRPSVLFALNISGPGNKIWKKARRTWVWCQGPGLPFRWQRSPPH
jgi:hypothetical protein